MFKDICSDFRLYDRHCNIKWCPNPFKAILIVLTCPGFFALFAYRFGHWCHYRYYSGESGLISSIFNIYYYIFKYVSIFICKTEINPKGHIGNSIFIPNTGNIVIGAEHIGDNCTIENAVTIGLGRFGNSPHIGDNVYVGSGSIIYGDITVGSNVRIAPNSVVASKIPSNCSVAGNPARVLPQ